MAIEQIKQHIQDNRNFLLSGGAGSGKTYTLMQVLDYVFEQNKNAKVACITYTNVAVNEIKERSPYSNLTVSTIHEFLWSQIKNYQKDLKKALIALIESRVIYYSGEVTLSLGFFNDKKIEYQEYKKLENGVVSHDDIIKLAHYMFEHYLMLNSIVKDKFDFIFVDEYQDTQKEVTDIFLNFMQQGERKSILGFFGDSMQSIYDKRVGNIDEYITQGVVERVVKADNRRCSTEVIRLINQIRNDGIVQEPANNNQAGSIKFLYSSREMSVNDIKQNIVFENWNFSDIKNTKELYLTHKLIANEQGFRSLLDVFSNDDVTSDKPNKFIAHLLRIEELIFLYENGFFNEFIKKTHFKVRKLSDKQRLKDAIENLKNIDDKNIERMIEFANELNLVNKDDKFNTYIREHDEEFNSAKLIAYREIQNLYMYRQELSPYSTQHGVKGAEFDNVFVILDNGRWNQYNFKYLFENTVGKESVIERTRKILYVACSRAKNNLVVYFPQPTQQVINKANEWFGDVNVIEI